MACAWDGGGRLFNTAPLYGLGLSEERLERAQRHRPRHEYVLSSNAGRLVERKPDARANGEPGGSTSPTPTRSAPTTRPTACCAASRPACCTWAPTGWTSCWCTTPPTTCPRPLRALPALARLRDEGVVGTIGAGMNQWQALAARRDADQGRRHGAQSPTPPARCTRATDSAADQVGDLIERRRWRRSAYLMANPTKSRCRITRSFPNVSVDAEHIPFCSLYSPESRTSARVELP